MLKKLMYCILLIAALTGCSSFLDSVLDAGLLGGPTAVQASAGKSVTPIMVKQAYASAIFTMVYYHGGYTFETKEYKPGEWTRWSATGMEQGEEFEKAFLSRTGDGDEWWQIIVRSVEDGAREEIILEALFSEPEDDYRELLRMRALFPGDEAPTELPVQKDGWYAQPAELTEENLEGAKKGKEKVSVPAGTFTADHVIYPDPRGTAEWWLASQVPGGIVKYSFQEEGEMAYAAELVDFGKKAGTRLDSY